MSANDKNIENGAPERQDSSHQPVDDVFEQALEILQKPIHERGAQQINHLIQITENFDFFRKINAKKAMRENEVHRKCCKRMRHEFYPPGKIIFREGEPPDKFYIVLKGSVNVLLQKDAERLNEEIVTMRNKYASIYKKAIELGSLREGMQRALMTEFAKINQKKIVYLLDKEVTYPLATGGVEVKDFENIEEFFQDGVFKYKCVASIEKGNIFGELGLIRKKPRAATIMVRRPTNFGTMTKSEYEDILLWMEQEKLYNKLKFFQKFLPNQLSLDSVTKFAYLFEKQKFSMNHDVFQPGEKAESVFFMKSGDVLLYQLSSQAQFTSALNAEKQSKKREENPLMHIPQSKKSQSNRLPTLSEGQYFGDEELFEGHDIRRYGAVCMSASATVFCADKEKFMQIVTQQQELTQFFEDKAKLKTVWHDRHKQFLENTKLTNKDRVFKEPEVIPVNSKRVTTTSLDRNFDKFKRAESRKAAGTTNNTASNGSVVIQQILPTGTSLDQPIPTQAETALDRSIMLPTDLSTIFYTMSSNKHPHPAQSQTSISNITKKKRFDSIRKITDSPNNVLDDSIVRVEQHLLTTQEHSRAFAARSQSKGVVSFLDFKKHDPNVEQRSLSTAEVMERKKKADSLDPNRHYNEIYTTGPGLFEKVQKRMVKSMLKTARSSSRDSLGHFKIDCVNMQSREGPSTLQKARNTYSMHSLTGTFWKKRANSTQQGQFLAQTLPSEQFMHSARDTPTPEDTSTDTAGFQPYESVKPSFMLTQIRRVQEVADEQDSFLDDHSFTNRAIKPKTQRSQSTGRLRTPAETARTALREDMGSANSRVHINKNFDIVPFTSREMILAMAGFEGIGEKQVRKGHWSALRATRQKSGDQSSLTRTDQSLPLVKIKNERSNLRNYYTKELAKPVSSPVKIEESKSKQQQQLEYYEKKLRKTKHSMFRFHHT